MKTLKIYNGSDWRHRGGHLYIAAYSLADAVRLVNEAYRKIHGYEDRPDINCVNVNYANNYWSKGCWGNSMDGITPERGVWHAKAIPGGLTEKPVRII